MLLVLYTFFSTKWINTLKKLMKIIILTLGPTNESKQKIKEDKELWSNLRDLIRPQVF